ncbi:MAG: hypothetical protein RXQ97_06830, partial [Caldivirga sp.]
LKNHHPRRARVAKVLSGLLYSVGAVYLSIVREVAVCCCEQRTGCNTASKAFYRKYRGEYLESHEPSQRSQ